MNVFQSLDIANLMIRNRIGVPAMCTYLVDTKDGVANEYHLAHYMNLALGQVGCIIQEATAVNEHGHISANCLGIYNERQVSKLKEIVQAVHKMGSVIGVQLNHSGMKNEFGNQRFSPVDAHDVLGLTSEQIDAIVYDFEKAAYNAYKAGYDFVEIHAAHGYLINQFLSPLINTRSDAYGADRTLFLRKVIAAVKLGFGERVWIRISAEEYEPSGLHLNDMIALCRTLEMEGIQLIDVSSGGLNTKPIDSFPLYQVGFAHAIKQAVSIPVACVGLITTVEQAETIIMEGKADLVLMGRKLLRDPLYLTQTIKSLGLLDRYKVPRYLKRGLL
ncbi:MAG: NADPH dehydrogenase [Erysipelotrichaceae bacterium]